MSKQTQKPKVDLRRTLTPVGSTILVSASALSIIKGRETIAELRWDQVQSIYAYTRYIDGVGALCLDFVLPVDEQGNEQRVVVHERLDGWASLKSELELAFPGLDKEWGTKAASEDVVSELARGGLGGIAPKFVANLVEVWRRRA
jgi:hypothetical protein